jgi:hypothetical protein
LFLVHQKQYQPGTAKLDEAANEADGSSWFCCRCIIWISVLVGLSRLFAFGWRRFQGRTSFNGGVLQAAKKGVASEIGRLRWLGLQTRCR